MDLTEEQKQETVNYNLNISNQLLMKSDMINKGRRAHDINKYASCIRNGLKDWGDKLTYDSEEFKRLCKYNQILSSQMFYAEHGL